MSRRNLVPSDVAFEALHGLGGDQLAALLPWRAHSEGWTWEEWNRAVAQWRTPSPTVGERLRSWWGALTGRRGRTPSRVRVKRKGGSPASVARAYNLDLTEVTSAPASDFPFNPQYGLTFANAPTYERDGRTYVDLEAGLELARRVIREDAELLLSLSDE